MISWVNCVRLNKCGALDLFCIWNTSCTLWRRRFVHEGVCANLNTCLHSYHCSGNCSFLLSNDKQEMWMPNWNSAVAYIIMCILNVFTNPFKMTVRSILILQYDRYNHLVVIYILSFKLLVIGCFDTFNTGFYLVCISTCNFSKAEPCIHQCSVTFYRQCIFYIWTLVKWVMQTSDRFACYVFINDITASI